MKASSRLRPTVLLLDVSATLLRERVAVGNGRAFRLRLPGKATLGILRVVPPEQRPTTETAAIEWLVIRVPELRPILDEHIEFNAEILSYVAFEGDFLRWFVERVREGEHEPARRFVAAVEPLMTTDVDPPAKDPVWYLASVCFVEGLVMQGDDDVVDAARPWMGSNTESDIDRIYRYRDEATKSVE